MLNAPKQSLKPSIFGCELREQIPTPVIAADNIFAYGWGDTADSNFSLVDEFNSFESLTTESVFTIPSSTKKIVLWLIGDTKPDTCEILEDVFPSYCDFAKCTIGTTCCSPLGVCCYNDGAGCTAPVSALECAALGGQHDPSKFTCAGYDCNSQYAHCCDLEIDACPGCFTCFESTPGAICKNGEPAIPGSCALSQCDDSACEDVVTNCVYSGGELTGCEDVCESQAAYPTASCDDCCYCEDQYGAECEGQFCCTINKDTGGEDCTTDCNCATGQVSSCNECNGHGLYSCDKTVGECRPDENGVPYNQCVAAGCTQEDTSGYNCELDEGSYNCVAVGSGATYKTFELCDAACGPPPGIECCQCSLGIPPNPSECCRIGKTATSDCASEYGADYFACSDCPTRCFGQTAVSCFALGTPDPTVSTLLTALANRDNTVYETAITTLNFGLDIPCDVCNVAGRDPGQQVLDCETRIPSRLKIEYILQNICSDDTVKLKISKTSSFINVTITVYPKENPSQEFTVYSDKISQSRQKDPVVGEFNCDICQFDYTCGIDGNSNTYIFNPPLSTFTFGPDTLFSHKRTSYVSDTDRYIQSEIKSIPSEENVWVESDLGNHNQVEDLSYSQLTSNCSGNFIVAGTRLFGTGIDGKYIANSDFTGAYGITCSCVTEEGGGCDSGYPINPGFITIAGAADTAL